jgi:hypothetical protein
MNQEAMQKLEQFRQMHLATDGEQTDQSVGKFGQEDQLS